MNFIPEPYACRRIWIIFLWATLFFGGCCMCNQPGVQTGFTWYSNVICLFFFFFTTLQYFWESHQRMWNYLKYSRIYSRKQRTVSAELSSMSLTLVNKTTSHHLSMPIYSLLLLKVFFESSLVPLITSGFFVLPLLIFHYFKPPASR